MHIKELLEALRSLQRALPTVDQDLDGAEATPRERKHLYEEARRTSDRLVRLVEAASPIKSPKFIFDPTDPTVAGELIANALLKQMRYPLSRVERTYGSGVYALYYLGPFDAYATSLLALHFVALLSPTTRTFLPLSERCCGSSSSGARASKSLRTISSHPFPRTSPGGRSSER